MLFFALCAAGGVDEMSDMAPRLRDGYVEKTSSIDEILRHRAVVSPDTIAYRYISGKSQSPLEITYAQVERRSRAIGAWLQSRHAEVGPVGLLLPHGPDFVAALFGTLYTGKIAIPLNPPSAKGSVIRLAAILADIGRITILTTGDLISRIRRSPELSVRGLPIDFVALETIPEAAWMQWCGQSQRAGRPAIVQYTSGSTAVPRGVSISHDNLLQNLSIMERVSALDGQSVGVSWLPQYHDMGLVGGILLPVYSGFPVTLMSPTAFMVRPISWLEAISQSRATVSAAPNFAYDLCARKISKDSMRGIDLSAWRVAYSGAEPIRSDTIDRFANAFAACGFRREAFFPCYGLAEATLMVTGGPPDSAPASCLLSRAALNRGRIVDAGPGTSEVTRLMSSGSLIAEQRVIIVDGRMPCSEDRVGEIWVAGASVGEGYWNKPTETVETFQAYLVNGEGPFLRTGDLGFIRDGKLFVSGRCKDLIICRGLNHHPQDIEQTVEESDARLRPGCGAVFSVETDGEEKLIIVHEIDRSARVWSDDLFEAVSRNIAERHGLAVHSILLIRHGTIPKTTSGKIQRLGCRSDFLTGDLAVVKEWHASDRNAVGRNFSPSEEVATREMRQQFEALLIGELAAVLAIEQQLIDRRQSIYLLGLDSLLATQLRNRLESMLGVDLQLTEFLQQPTVENVAAEILAQLAARGSWSSVERISTIMAQVSQLSEDEVVLALEAERASANNGVS
jgi:acyl-CoA synthetase (AMP-forming)/AMP-acid ligase II/acyl carrier protein